MTTHFKGPVRGAVNAGGGLFEDKPIHCMDRGMFVEYFEDFTARASVEGQWTETAVVGVGTAADVVDDATRGILRLTSTTVNQGTGSLQPAVVADTSGCHAPTGAGQDILFEASVSIDDWSNCDWLVGIGLRDTTILVAAGTIAAVFGDNFAAFHHLLGQGGIPATRAGGTALANAQTFTSTITTGLTDATYYRFGIRVSGLDRVRFYLNRLPVTGWCAVSPNFANNALLVPSFAMIANGAAIVMDIDYVHLISERTY